MRRLGITVGSLVLIAACGMAYAWYAAGAVVANRAAFAFPRADLFRYSAKWWSYLVPPVAHPLLGATAHRIWTAAGVREGLLEQQVSLGWGIVALGLIAHRSAWLRPASRTTVARRGARVPVLVVVAVAALVCSLSPERTIGAFTFVRPSALLYDVVPMFRSYARFGVVVQLMAALLAGIGVDYLRRAGTRRAQIVCLALVALGRRRVRRLRRRRCGATCCPTTAHRWVMRQPGRVRALDCAPLDQESESVQWLTGDRVTLLGGAIERLHRAEPARRSLRRSGYTHLLVRRDTADGQWFADHATPDGLRVAARFDDGQVFAVTARSAGDLYRDDDGILSARARRGVVVAMDGSRRGVDDREHRRAADRRDARLELSAFHRRAPHRSCGSTAARCRRSSSSHRAASTRSVRSPWLPATTSSCFIRLKRADGGRTT